MSLDPVLSVRIPGVFYHVSLLNFHTDHVDVGPTLTKRFAPNANYKRYNDLPTLVNFSQFSRFVLRTPDVHYTPYPLMLARGGFNIVEVR